MLNNSTVAVRAVLAVILIIAAQVNSSNSTHRHLAREDVLLWQGKEEGQRLLAPLSVPKGDTSW